MPSPQCRSDLRGPASAGKQAPAGNIRVWRCDVTDDAGVRAFATELSDAAIDMVIDNAGEEILAQLTD